MSAQSAPTTPSRSNGHHNGHANGKGVELPLKPILALLPLELQPRVLQADVGNLTLSVPLEKILAQLSRGSVKISFGELRQAVPGVFSTEPDRDRVMVPLPLGEVLSRVNPALIQRRRTQRVVEVPSEITSPFDPNRRTVVPSPAAPVDVAPVPPRAATPPPPSPPPPPPAKPATPSGRTTHFVRQMGVKPSAPELPGSGMPKAPTLPPQRTHPAIRPLQASPAAPSVPYVPAPVKLRASQDGNGHTSPPIPVQPRGQENASPEDNPLMLLLASLADTWPDAVRREIVQLKLVDAKIAMPSDLVEKGLRQGRLSFSWKTVRSWVRPPLPPSPSSQDTVVLELPLKIVAPLFLARRKAQNQVQQKIVAVDESIPNLFFGFPEADPPPGAATKNPDTNYYGTEDAPEGQPAGGTSPRPTPQRTAIPGTTFVAKYATPNEIVSRAAALDGVAGALVALPDGLLVASRLSADLNADTLAAFLPQIFAKVSQCTNELRMGELNNLNFTVGRVPWKIFRVNAIFFAAFGRVGELLPGAQLASLAGELDHRPR